MSPHISVIVNAHNEGLLLYPTLRSAEAAANYAAQHQLSCELIVVLDHPDAPTRQYLQAYAASSAYVWTIVDVHYSDLGLSRNEGARRARGTYLAFLDGDDLFGEQWLYRAHAYYQRAADQDWILHPEVNVIFGKDDHLYIHTDMDDADFDLDLLRIENYWTALSFSRRQTYLDHPFSPNNLDDGFGFEDWLWNSNLIAAGYTHKVVPDTCHFIRRKTSGSLLAQTQAAKCIVPPGRLFGVGKSRLRRD